MSTFIRSVVFVLCSCPFFAQVEAADLEDVETQVSIQNIVSDLPVMSDWRERHGPEKPPPDDGYSFKGTKGGNAKGKLGLVAFGAGVVTGVLYLKADDGSDKQAKMGKSTIGLLGGGLTLLIWERMS